MKSQKVWWIDKINVGGEILFSFFDQKKIYNLFRDYPHNMTEEEARIYIKSHGEIFLSVIEYEL